MWKRIKETQYFLLFSQERGYEICITDYLNVWTTLCSEKAFLAQLKESNDGLELPHDSEFVQKGVHLLSNLDNLKKFNIEKKENGKSLFITMTTSFGFPFHFECTLSKGSEELYFQKVTRPLLKIICDLRESQSELRDLLIQKDSEIEEYKCEGGEIVFRHLKTTAFNDAEHMKKHKVFEESFGASNSSTELEAAVEILEKTVLKQDLKEIENPDPAPSIKTEPVSAIKTEPDTTVKMELDTTEYVSLIKVEPKTEASEETNVPLKREQARAHVPRKRYKMPRKNTVLNSQARKLIYHVNCFMKKEAEEGVINLKQVQKRTADATNTSVATVRRIMKESGGGEFLSVFRTPGKKRTRAKPITDVDNFDLGVIKRCIHSFHITEKELPTVEKLRRKLQNDINFQGSERSLRRIIKNLCFKWKKTENNRQVLIETSNIRLKRIEYLKRMSQYRHEGRPIVYTDESYVDSSHSTPKAWSAESTKGIKKPISKGQRVVIVHAGSETGFIPNALLTFKADIKTGDYHDKMNFDNYEKWLRTQLIPNLPSNSVVVVDNASYHNKQYDPAPTSNAKKSEMQAWLTEKGIEYSEDMLKPQLYNQIKCHKDKYKQINIDRMLAEHNHDVIRLPPYHPDLNPIEMAWVAIKGYVSRKNVTWSVKGVTDLVKEKVDLMGASEWNKLCEKVKNIEEEYKRSDHVVDMLTEELIIRINTDSDSDSDDFTDSDDDEEDDDEMPTASISAITESDLMEG